MNPQECNCYVCTQARYRGTLQWQLDQTEWRHQPVPVPAPEPELDRIDYYRKPPDGEYVLMGSTAPGEVFVDNSESEVPEAISSMQKIRLASVRDQADLDRLVTGLTVEAYNRGMKGAQ